MILGGSEVLSKYGERISPEDRAAALADINESARRLGQLIDNLLLLSRLEVGTSFELEPILVRHEIERIVEGYRRREPNRTFTVTIDPVLSPVNAEPTNFQQVLQNLLGNAIKYSPPGSPIEVTTQRSGEELIVSVLDRGQGIAPDELERVFEPFYRSKRTSEGTAGAGVGLAVCRRLIEAQGGRIWTEPREGGGTVFSIALPLDTTLE
jgi:two-component system, OmpR family, sensor histidine kinase KdpD